MSRPTEPTVQVSDGLPGRPGCDASGANAGSADPVAKHTENRQRLRDLISRLPAKQFSMATWIVHDGAATDAPPPQHDCGTVACLGGWGAMLMCKAGVTGLLYEADVGEWLGLNRTASFALFQPHGYWSAGYSKARALRTLDHLIATGEVDWDLTRRAAPPPANPTQAAA